MRIWWYFAVVLPGLAVWVNVLKSFVLLELNMLFVSLFAISSTFYINSDSLQRQTILRLSVYLQHLAFFPQRFLIFCV